MGLAARAAAGPARKVATPCYLGQFIAWLDTQDPAEADGLRAMLDPRSGWSNPDIAAAVNEEYGPKPLVRAGVVLRLDEHGEVADTAVGRHRRALPNPERPGPRKNACQCQAASA